MTATTTSTPGFKALHLNPSFEGASRYLGDIERTGMKWITVHKDLQLWTVDGTAGATYTAAVGTNAQQLHPTLGFAFETADDFAFIRDTVPYEFKPEGKVYLVIKWSSTDHDPTHTVKWDGTMRRIPCGDARVSNVDYAGNVVQDGAGTGLTIHTSYCDDTASEIVTTYLPLDAIDLYPLDTLQLQLFMDESACTVAAAVTVHDTALVYER